MRADGVGDDVRLDCRLTESDLASTLHVVDALLAHEPVDEALLNSGAASGAFFVDERIGVEELLLLGYLAGAFGVVRAFADMASIRVVIAATDVRSGRPSGTLPRPVSLARGARPCAGVRPGR